MKLILALILTSGAFAQGAKSLNVPPSSSYPLAAPELKFRAPSSETLGPRHRILLIRELGKNEDKVLREKFQKVMDEVKKSY